MGCSWSCCPSCPTYKLDTSVDINAPPQIVWEILRDFDKWSEWAVFMKPHGEMRVGATLENTMGKFTSSEKPMIFRPKVLNAKENEEFRWVGVLGCGGIFDGEHYFILQPLGANGQSTRLLHGENFYGCLTISCFCCLGCLIMNETKSNFLAFNQSLKERAEKRRSESAASTPVMDVGILAGPTPPVASNVINVRALG